MKRTKKQAKRVLSVCLSVLMLLSAWVFVAPQQAAAATMETAPLLGRYFSTSNVFYDAVSGTNAIETVTGTDPGYDASTESASLAGDGYLKITTPDLFSGVTADTGLSIAYTYMSAKNEPHDHLISCGYSPYGGTFARHFYIAATYLGSGTPNHAMFIEWADASEGKHIRCYIDGFTFAANTTYEVVVTFSVTEGVIYTVNGTRYNAVYMDSSLDAQKGYIADFLNDVHNYQNNYIGRSRWTADGNFAGKIKDLRIYGEDLSQSPLLGRFFSTDNVWYDATTYYGSGLISAGGTAPSYDSSTGMTTLNSNNYLEIANRHLFSGVTAQTGLTLAFTYKPIQNLHYVQLLSFGKYPYSTSSDETSDHFYIGATFHDSYHGSTVTANPLVFEWRNGSSSLTVAYPHDLEFIANKTYDVVITVTPTEGVVYTVNGVKYNTTYHNSSLAAQRGNITSFLNTVSQYQYGYIGRSRWRGDTSFAGGMKDLRIYREAAVSAPLLGRYFSTSDVWYDAVTKNTSGLTHVAGEFPSYNAATGYTYLKGNNNNSYVSITNSSVFAGVNASTGLTIAFTYQPMQTDRYVQLLSFGYDAYGSGQQRHLYVGATYHASRGGDTTPLFMDWMDGSSTAHIRSTPQGLTFAVNQIYDVIISISATEGVTYVVNGVKYNTVYEGSNFENEKQYIAAFLNDVSTYTKNYIGRSRWSGDKSFDGNIKDLRLYGCALMEKQSLIDYNASLFDAVNSQYADVSLTTKLTQSNNINKFQAPAFHYATTTDGGYSNLAYATGSDSEGGNMGIRGADGSDDYKDIYATYFKLFAPLTSVMVRDGVNDAYAPIEMETKKHDKANVNDQKIHYVTTANNTKPFVLKQYWNGYLDGDWKTWAGSYTTHQISSDPGVESGFVSDNKDTPRFWWNALKYTGQGNTTSYFEYASDVQYSIRAYFNYTIGGTDTGNDTITSLADYYVLNYQPVYDALPNALACYNEITANSWMYTEESLNRAKATIVQMVAANPNNYGNAYAADTSMAVAECGANITRAVNLLGASGAGYTYGYEGLQLVKKQGTVEFVDEDGTVLLSAVPYDYGTAASAITKPADPTKPQDNIYTYTFSGWTPAIALVDSPAATYTATYTPALREYAVTLAADGTGYTVTTEPAATVNYDGTVSFAITLADGYSNSADPTCTATNAGTVTASRSGNVITYTVPNITAASTITVGPATINSYSVTLNSNGTGYSVTTSPAATVNHGSNVTFAITLDAGYSASADPTCTATNAGTVTASKSGNVITYTVPNVTGATTITLGAATINTYTVTFEDWNGTELSSQTVNHGANATPPADPTRSPDASNHYSFDGWDAADYTNITETKTITATYTDEAHYGGTATCLNGKICQEPGCGYEYTAVDTVNGHDWSSVSYTWSADNSTCTASRACQRSGCGATETETANATSEPTKDATCTESSETTFTATFDNAAFEQQVNVVGNNDALGHEWDYAHATYVWDGYTSCTATVPCTRHASCGYSFPAITSSSVSVSTSVPATCLVEGEELYTAVFAGRPQLSATKTKNIGYGAHELGEQIAAQAGEDCQHNGTVAYYHCSVCGQNFEDANAQTVLTSLDNNTPGAHDFSVLQYNETNHWYKCSKCDATSEAEAHSGGSATCKEKAKCTVCDQEYGSYAAHALTPVDAVAGIDCQHTGTLAHYHCSVCEKNFADANAQNELASLDDNTPGAHDFSVLQYNETNHWYKCSKCDATNGNEAHSGGSATCIAKAKCDVCDQEYGAYAAHTLTPVDAIAGVDCQHTGMLAHYHCSVCEKNFADANAETELASLDNNTPGAHDFSVLQYDENNHWYKCSKCDATNGNEAHSGGSATCNEKAKCIVCNQEYGNFGAHATEAVEAAAGTDCQHNGTIAHYACTVCRKTFSDAAATNEITELSDGTPGAHTLTPVDAVAGIDCLHTGTIAHFECTVCHHTFSDAEGENEITDLSNGTPGAHTTEAVAAAAGIDCQHTGTIAHYECTVCHKTFSDAAATDEITELSDGVPGAHSFTEYTYNNDATCTADGTETAHCDNNCGTDDTRPKEGTKLSHTGGTATCTELAVCDLCHEPYGEPDYTNHSTTETYVLNAKEPGYTFKGYTGDTYCEACDHLISLGEDIAKRSLSENAAYAAALEILEDAANDPTLYDENDIATLNAKLAEVDFAAATDNNDTAVNARLSELAVIVGGISELAYYTVIFKVDGGTVSTQTVLAGGSATPPEEPEFVNIEGDTHQRFSGWSGNYTGVTGDEIVTSSYIEEPHTWIDGEVISAATCVAAGSQAISCACGAHSTKTLAVDADNHTGVNTVTHEDEVAATCTEAGSYTEVVTCECGVVISSTPKTSDPLGHLFGEYTYDENATCEEDGTETAVCERCGQPQSRTADGTKLGHDWGDWVVTKAATCTETGRKTRTCTHDESHTQVEVLQMISHTDSNGDGVCDVCGTQMVDHQHKDGNFDNVCDDCGQTIDTGFRCSWCNRNDEMQASSSNGFVKFVFTFFHLFVHAFQSFRNFVIH